MSVFVIGDIILDRYWFGDVERISPEAPVPVVKVMRKEDRLGGAANVALNIRSLGADVQLCGVVGYDPAGDCVLDLVSKIGIGHQIARIESVSTIEKTRVIGRNQQIVRADCSDFVELSYWDFWLGQCESIVISDYGKGTVPRNTLLISDYTNNNITVLVDPYGTDYGKYKNATLIKPNLHEFEAVVGKCETEAQILERGRNLIDELGIKALLVTRGADGMTLIEPDQHKHYPSQAQQVFDVTGAGDTVIATIAAFLDKGSSLDTACQMANKAAGIVVGKLGTSSVTWEEMFVT